MSTMEKIEPPLTDGWGVLRPETKKYLIDWEVAGDYAYWGIPSASDTYPAPTPSGIVGMMKSILMLSNAQVIPLSVEICRPLGYHSFAMNYRGPLRYKTDQKAGVSAQIRMRVLTNVCYKIHAVSVARNIPAEFATPQARKRFQNDNGWHINGAHAYQEMFRRRLRQGKCFRPVCLGISEFACNYVGPIRAETSADKSIDDIVIPTMVNQTHSNYYKGEEKTTYLQNVCIKEGVVTYHA